MQLRLMGLLCDVFIYNKNIASKPKIYTPEQVIDVIDKTMNFIQQTENNKFIDEKHVVNTLVGCLKRNLAMYYGENNIDMSEIEDCDL